MIRSKNRVPRLGLDLARHENFSVVFDGVEWASASKDCPTLQIQRWKEQRERERAFRVTTPMNKKLEFEISIFRQMKLEFKQLKS